MLLKEKNKSTGNPLRNFFDSVSLWIRSPITIQGKEKKLINKSIKKNQRKLNYRHLNYYIFKIEKALFLTRFLFLFSPICLIISATLFMAVLPVYDGIFVESDSVELNRMLNTILNDILNWGKPLEAMSKSFDGAITKVETNYLGNLTFEIQKTANVYRGFQIVLYFGIYSIVSYFYNKFCYKWLSDYFNIIRKSDLKDIVYPFNYRDSKLLIGKVYDERSLDLIQNPKYVYIPEKGLFQNILIIGSISTGKTVAALAQFVKQTIFMDYDDPDKKCAALALDVKGNFAEIPIRHLKESNREEDLIVISITGDIKVNPLHKPNLSPMEIASRMRTVLEMFSKSGNEDYFIEKAETALSEIIKLKRVQCGYVTFDDIHELIIYEQKRLDIFEELDKRRRQGDLSDIEQYDYLSGKSYFENEFNKLDNKLREIIVSEVTRMTNPFISKKEIKDIFCPTVEEINFIGFKEVIQEGKFVIWSINGNKEKKLSKLVAAYLKIDWQEEVLNTLDPDSDEVARKRKKVLVCDEYQHYVTKNDADFISQSREAKGISIVATQSYSSLLQALKNDEQVFNMLNQSFINKIIFRTDDTSFTIRKVKEQLGKFDKEKVSHNISESARDSKADYVLGQSFGEKKNLSTSTSVSTERTEIFDESFLNRRLTEGKALCLLSDGKQLYDPIVVHLPRQHVEGRLKLLDPSNSIFQWIDFRPDAVSDTLISLEQTVLSEDCEVERKEVEIRASKKDEIIPEKKEPELVFVDHSVEKVVEPKLEEPKTKAAKPRATKPRESKPIKPQEPGISLDLDGESKQLTIEIFENGYSVDPETGEIIDRIVSVDTPTPFDSDKKGVTDINPEMIELDVEPLHDEVEKIEIDKSKVEIEIAKSHSFGDFF